MVRSFCQKYVTTKVLTPGGSEVVTTAILQRRQSYTHSGDQTKDTITCATSQHTTSPGGQPFTTFPGASLPPCRSHDQPPTSECEAYSGPAPCFMRLNSVQPFTLVFPAHEPHLASLSVQEVIDALSDQLGGELMQSLLGVRLVGGSCYLSFSAQHDADVALAATLSLRGAPLRLEDASVGATILSLTGVPHDLADEGVATVLSHFGSLVGPVERRVYKGVDTGERLVRVRARLAIPRWIWLDGCRVCLKVLRSEDIAHHPMTRRKSFRSHINVQLKPIVDDGSPPGPSSPGASPLSTPPPRTTFASTNPFACGSVPSFPVVPTAAGSSLPYLNNTSVSTPNIFQESPFSFPSPFQTAEPPGLRRINSVMGTMSLGTPPEATHARSASSPPNASSASPRNTIITDGERCETTGQTGIPPSPNTPRKTLQRHKPSRKISKMSMDSRKTNGETSSSDQDSPNKPGRRRPSTVIFKQKPILNRTLSSELDCTGYEATCSERERSNSDLSSRQSICKRKLSTTGRESGKVPWCGCWGNGCI